MTQSYSHLLKPGRIGSMTLKNRMVVTAMGVNLAEEDGTCGERILRFHEEQARGGAGMIVMGVAGVAWPDGGNQPRQVAISEDRFIPGLKAVADAVHRHGGKLAIQLHHGGLVAAEDRVAGRPLWVPSYPVVTQGNMEQAFLEEELKAMFDPDMPEVQLHVMTREDIQTLVRKFGEAAARVKAAGLDGIEIHAGHGYIISEFLSPQTNRRDDEYGGSLENRARLLLEIIAAVREAVGGEFPLWCKLDSGEFGIVEGITLADARKTAQLAQQAGVDAITVSAYHDPSQASMHSESNIPHVPERLVPNATAIRQGLSIPVITSGRIEPERADRHIGMGHFDFFAMGRKMLADPHLPRKIAEGRPEDIRPCVYCYCCVSQIYILKPVKCAVNPETAMEQSRQLIPATTMKHYAVVGGGPAGMEVALRLTRRGHRVTLLEQSDRLGGTLQFASLAYPPNEKLLRWLRRQIEQSTVAVQLNAPADAQRLRQLGVDEVIVATGARRTMPELPGSNQDFVFSGEDMRSLVLGENLDLLERKTTGLTRWLMRTGARTGLTRHLGLLRQGSRWWLPLGQEIVVIGSELVGLELAEFLSERGRRVTVIDEPPRPGRGLYLVRRMRLLDELQELGVAIQSGARDVRIGDREVSYTNYRGQERTVSADHVVVARGATGDLELADRLQAEGFTVHTIGDCTGVGYIEGAMHDAAELAVSLE